ncbi:unnamed protein product [Boreogadus saida]
MNLCSLISRLAQSMCRQKVMVGELNLWFHEDPQDSVENKQIMPWSVWLDFENTCECGVSQQRNPFLFQNNLLDPNQSGVNGGPVLNLFNLSVAFGTVNHHIHLSRHRQS